MNQNRMRYPTWMTARAAALALGFVLGACCVLVDAGHARAEICPPEDGAACFVRCRLHKRDCAAACRADKRQCLLRVRAGLQECKLGCRSDAAADPDVSSCKRNCVARAIDVTGSLAAFSWWITWTC